MAFFCLLLMKNIYVFDVANYMTKKNHQKTQWLLGSDPKAQKYDTSLPKSHNEEIVSPTQEGQHH